MKRMLHFLLLVVAFVPMRVGAQTQNLTVAGGAEANAYVPFHGLYVDTDGQAQIIYPADMISQMRGGTIMALKFYLAAPASYAWGLEDVEVRLTTTNSMNDFSGGSFVDIPGTAAWTGLVDGNTLEWSINLSTPFVYTGGNLIIDVRHEGSGNYASASFLGEMATAASISVYYTVFYSPVVRNFRPKTTFTYVADPTVRVCPVPSGVTGVNLTSSTADIVWNPTHDSVTEVNVEWGPIGFAHGTGTAELPVDDTVHLVGLDPGTYYEVHVSSTCSDTTSNFATYTFRTLAVPATLPYHTGFETGDDMGWTFVNNNDNKWCIGDATACAGTHAMYISNNNGVTNAYSTGTAANSYAYRGFIVEDSASYLIAFDWKGGGESTYDWLDVFVVNADSADLNVPANSINRSGWIGLNNSRLNLVSDWTTASYATTLTPGNWYLIYRWTNDNSSGAQPPAAIDNVLIRPNTCPAPTQLEFTNLGSTSATLSWVVNGEEVSWLVRANGGPWQEAINNPYTITGLTPGTYYTFEVCAYCEEGDTSLAVSRSAYTECVPITMPFSESFESYQSGTSAAFSPCWVRGYISTGANTYPYRDAANNTTVLQFSTYGTGQNWVLLPPIDTSVAINTLELTFDLSKSAAGHNATFIVGLVDDLTWDNDSDMDTITTITAADIPTLTYGSFTADFTSYTGSRRYIALVNVSSSYSYTRLDNIYLAVAPTCDGPTGITVEGATTESITVSTTGTNSNYSYSIMQGTTLIAQASASDTFYTFTGLTPATQYVVSASGICDDGTITRPHSTSTYTACVPVDTVPYVLDLNAAITGTTSPFFHPCWVKGDTYSASGHGYPYVTSARELSFYGSDGTMCWTIMPELDTDLILADLELTFDARGYTIANYYDGQLIVGLVPDGNFVPGTTTIDTIFSHNFTATTSPQRQYIHFNHYNGSNRRIIFFSPAPVGASCYVYLSAIDLHITPPCIQPSDLTLLSATPDSLFISWTAVDGAYDGFLAEYRPTGSDVWLEVTDIVDTTAIIGDLTENTAYDFRVMSNCGNGVTSVWNTALFRTSCTPLHSFPHVENFQSLNTGSTAEFDHCWGKGASNGTFPYVSNSHGSKILYCYTYNLHYNYAIMPEIVDTLAINRFELSFRARLGSTDYYTGYTAHFKVGLIDGNTYVKDVTPIDILAEFNAPIDRWETYYLPLDTYTGSKRRIIFLVESINGSDNYVGIDDIDLHFMPGCIQRPTHLTVTGATTNTISIAYDGLSTNTYLVSWTDTTGATSSATTTGNTYTITGLANLMHYDITVAGICASGDTSEAFTTASTTTVGGINTPYFTGFEPTDDRAWTCIQGRNPWTIGTAAHSDGSTASLYITDTTGLNQAYVPDSAAISYTYRTLNFSPGQYEISFDWMGMGFVAYGFYYNYLRAWLVPANVAFAPNRFPDGSYPIETYNYAFTSPEGWIELGGPLANASAWQNSSHIIDIPANGVYHLVFMWVNSNSTFATSTQSIAIDNVHVEALTCPTPTGLTLDAVSDLTATLSWVPRAGESSWFISLSDGSTRIASSTPYTITGLRPDTPYDVVLRSICSATDSSHGVSLTFRTNCAATYSVPYAEEFREFSPCWTNTTIGTTTAYRWRNNVYYDGDAFSYTLSQAVANSTANDWLISPPIAIPTMTTDLNVCFQTAADTSTTLGNSKGIYEVLVSPSGADSIGAFTHSLLVDTVLSSTFAWRRLPLAAFGGQNIRIAIRNISTNSAAIGISKFGVRYTNRPLYFVYGPSMAYVGDTLGWKADYQEGSLAGMTFAWSSSMAAAGHATLAGSTSDSLTIAYSAAGIDTLLFIASNPFAADTTRLIVTVYDCSHPVATFPFLESFEAAEAPSGCWQIVYADPNYPAANTMIHTSDISFNSIPTSAHHGRRAFRFSSYSLGTDYTQYLISQEFDGDSLNLSFWHAKFNTGVERLSVGYSSTSRDTSAFVWGDWFEPNTAWTKFSQNAPPNTKYFAIRYHGDFSYYVYIDDLTVTGITPPCDAPTVSLDTVGETSATISITTEAPSYQVAIVEGAWVEPDAADLTNIASPTHTFSDLAPLTSYTIGVRTPCTGGGSSQWATLAITTLEHPCFAPTGVTVSNITFDGATIAWTPGENESTWEVNITGPSYDQTFTTTTNSYAVSGLASNELFTVRVRALCSETQQSDWSQPAQFTTERCQPVTGVTATATTFETATVTWNPTMDGSGNYEVEYGLSGFRQGDGTRVTVTGATIYAISGLDEETSYDVYVRSICTAGLTSEWSAVSTFTTPQSDGIQPLTSDLQPNIYPNPASTTVTLSGLEPGATVTIVDLNGREVAEFKIQNSEFKIDVTSLASGAYFVRVTGERQTAVRKLIVK